MGSSGPSTEISSASRDNSSGETGGNRGSRVAESRAQRTTSSASVPSSRSTPRQPRRSPSRLSVTKTPDASGRSPPTS